MLSNAIAEIYEKAGLQAVKIDGKWCLIRSDIDLDQVDEDGISNRERMERGRPLSQKTAKRWKLYIASSCSLSAVCMVSMSFYSASYLDRVWFQGI